MSDDSSKKKRLRWLKSPSGEVKDRPNFGSPWAVIGTLVAAFIVSQIIAVILLGIILGLAGSTSSAEDSIAAQFIYVLIAEGLAVGIVYFVLKRRNLGFSDIGLGRRPKWRDLKVAVSGFLIYYVLLTITILLISYFVPSFDADQPQDVGFKDIQTGLERLMGFVALVLLPPIGEEILMRGYLYTGLRARMRFFWALVITSIVFGLAHLQFGSEAPLVWAAGISTFVLSVVLVYSREITGALYAAILIHAANNAIAFLIHF